MVLAALATPVPPFAPLSGLEKTGEPAISGLVIVALVAKTTLPVPVTPFSPRTPELLYSISPLVPLLTTVEPTVSAVTAPAGAHVEPNVQVVPLTTILELTRSGLVTNPVAVKAPVTVGLVSVAVLIVGLVKVLLVSVSVVARPTN